MNFKWLKKRIDPVPVMIEPPKPKIISAPTLKPTKCAFCTTVYQGEVTQLEPGWFTIDRVKKTLRCPVCNSLNDVEFEEASDDTVS